MSDSDFQPGDEVTSPRLNARAAEAAASRVIIAAGSGFGAIETPEGLHPYVIEPPEFWFKVTGAGSNGSGWYALTEQCPAASGGWTDGPRKVQAHESTANAAVPSSASSAPTIVRAWRGTLRWEFTWGACS